MVRIRNLCAQIQSNKALNSGQNQHVCRIGRGSAFAISSDLWYNTSKEVNNMGESQTRTKYKGKNFIRVFLQSGTRANPMGDEELAIFCQCNNETPSIEDVDTNGLIRWVNNNPECQKNQSRNYYRLSTENDAMSVVFLNMREIESCHNANRIFPRLLPKRVQQKGNATEA